MIMYSSSITFNVMNVGLNARKSPQKCSEVFIIPVSDNKFAKLQQMNGVSLQSAREQEQSHNITID